MFLLIAGKLQGAERLARAARCREPSIDPTRFAGCKTCSGLIGLHEVVRVEC